MPIYATNNERDFEKVPAGYPRAVCCQVIDRGKVHDDFKDGDVRKITIVWQVEATDENGRRLQIAKWYNLSLHEKATLTGHIEDWLGVSLPKDPVERYAFDFKSLEGRNCILHVKHKPRDKGVSVQVKAVMPPKAGEESAIQPLDYEPRKEPVLDIDGYPTEVFP